MATILNPGFEIDGSGGADVFQSWTESSGTGTISKETTIKHSGSACLKLVAGSSANTYIYQTFVIIPGVDQELTFFSRGDGTNSGRYIIRDYSNSQDLTSLLSTGITGEEWRAVNYTFTAPSTCTVILLHLRCPATDGGAAYFDDISMRARPIRESLWVPWRR